MESKNVIAYMRISDRSGTETDLSIERQRRTIQAWAESAGKVIISEHIDAGISGRRVRRPALDKAILAAKMHKAPIIVAALDRLGRSSKILDRLETHKVRFIPLDLPQASELVIDIMMSINKAYSAAVSTKMVAYHADRQARVEKGETTAHPVPEAGIWQRANPEATKAICAEARRAKAHKYADVATDINAYVLSLKAEGMSIRKIVKHLNDQGMTTPAGKQWHIVTVHRIVKASA